MTVLQRVAIGGAATVFGLLLLGLAGIFMLSRRDPEAMFLERQGALVQSSLEEYERDSIATKSWLRINSSSGLSVTCGILVPRNSGRRHPAIIVLGGKATGRYAVDYALGVRNVVIVAPDYPYEPRADYSILDLAADLPAIRRAIFDMIPSISLVTDYLRSRPDVDTARIILMGYSFGAPFIPVIASRDRREAIAVMVYGGGDMTSLIGHNVARFEGSLMGTLVGSVSGLLLRPLEPLRHVERISPIPLLMVNGTDDEQVPRENTMMLFNRAREPKKIIWIESRHVNPRNVELTRRIIKTLEDEFASRGLLQPFFGPAGSADH